MRLREDFKNVLPAFMTCAVLAWALAAHGLGGWPAPWPWLETVRAEVFALASHPSDQWMMAVCIGVYLAGFVYLENLRRQQPCWRDVRGMLALTLGCWAGWVYARDYAVAARGTDFLVFVAALAFANVTRFVCTDEARRKFVMRFLVLSLTVASCVRVGGGLSYQYRGEPRLRGPWDNPNTFGLLMAVAVILSLGLALDAWCRRPKTSDCVLSRLRRFVPLIWLICAVIAGDALVRSYSRGAWLGAALGLGWWVWRWLRSLSEGPAPPPRPVLLRRCALPALVLCLSLGVIAFWNFRNTEVPVVRRAFSAGNLNDFSWRNRVATWPGALEVMARKPVSGWGWNRPATVFEHGHKPASLNEGGAISLNSYLMLGMTLGLPALLGFLAWVWLSLRTNDDSDRMNLENVPEVGPMARHSYKAAVLALLAGLAFDGGISKLCVAVPFALMLELCHADSPRIPSQPAGGERPSIK